jgi:hypothetical protein
VQVQNKNQKTLNMERPINRKQRDAAILRFLFICVISLLLIVFHIYVSMIVYQSGNIQEDASIQGNSNQVNIEIFNSSSGPIIRIISIKFL